MARRLLLLTLALASSAALAQTRTEQLQTVGTPGPIDKTTQTEDVHFRADLYQRMTVPVRVSGTGPYRFLVDTGSQTSLIDPVLGTRLRLQPTFRVELMTQSTTRLRPALCPRSPSSSRSSMPAASADNTSS